MSVIFLPSVISSDSITFLVFFLFGDLGERLVVDLMVWDAPGGGGAVFGGGGVVGLCTEAKQDRSVNILFTFISNSYLWKAQMPSGFKSRCCWKPVQASSQPSTNYSKLMNSENALLLKKKKIYSQITVSYDLEQRLRNQKTWIPVLDLQGSAVDLGQMGKPSWITLPANWHVFS